MLPATGAYAAAEAARDLVITDYRLSPPTWPKERRLTVTVIADLHAGGPTWASVACARWWIRVMLSAAISSSCLAIISRRIPLLRNACRRRPGQPSLRACAG